MLLFPHDTPRPSQQAFIEKVQLAIGLGKNLLVHAPTGLGKTAAAISPALTAALKSDFTVFFLTSRHTQHEIALKTLKAIKAKHNTDFVAVDVIGKKWMCLQQGIERLPNQEFTEFCRALREDGKCHFYSKLKNGEKLTPEAKITVDMLKKMSPVANQDIITECQNNELCPYYTSMELSKKAKVIIGDYYYIFHPRVREQFFNRSGNELEKAIIIVDEAHNLPSRIKDLSTSKTSNLILFRAIKEADKYKHIHVKDWLEHILAFFTKQATNIRAQQQYETHITREAFIKHVELSSDYEVVAETMVNVGDAIREESKVSFIGAVGNFLEQWKGNDEGFTRILSRRKGLREEIITLSYRCLDPSLVARPLINQAHSTILMSGTLEPLPMYQETLGVELADNVTYPSPFPKENKLNLIIPQTSTKFTSRSEEQYKNIAHILAKVCDNIPGNSAVFFPSYYLLNEVNKYFSTLTEKTVFTERQEMNTTEKQEFIDRFRGYKDSGAALLGVISGNFGEGIDLPGDELKGVVIVGLPLQKPDLETEALIKYYDEKFRKGWDYGYLFPAFNKTLQSAGRCIRSETDKGVIVFLDERYAWPNYKRCFPKDWDITVSLQYEKLIKDFFTQ